MHSGYMTAQDIMLKKEPTRRLNSRIFISQYDFIEKEVQKSKEKMTEGEVLRQLLDEAIASRKKK